MTVENGSKSRFYSQVANMVQKLEAQKPPPMPVRIDEGQKRLEASIARKKAELEQKKASASLQKSKKPTTEEYRTQKDLLPQIWKFDGPKGVHRLMQKRPAPNYAIPVPQEVFPQQELRDKKMVYPPKKKPGWGIYGNQTREEVADQLRETGINALLNRAQFIDENPEDPEVVQLLNTFFRK